MFRSLRFRLALSHALVLAVILVLLGWAVQFLLARSLDASITKELTAQAQGQVGRIQEIGHAIPPVDSDVPSAAGVQIAVYQPDGMLAGESPEIPAWLKRYPDGVTDLRYLGEPVRIVTVSAVVEGQTVGWVAVGRSTVPEEHLLERVRLFLVLAGSVAVLISLGAGWWLAGRAVRPVELAYEAQAGFAADASHEFRTPLTFIRSGVEVLAEKDPKLGGDVLSEVDYLTGLTQRLLLLARAERGAVVLEPEPVDVAEVCRSASLRSERAYGNRLTLDGPPGVAALADQVGLEAVLDAVLENVHVHGGGSAEVRWAAQGDESHVTVSDHGEGIPAVDAHRAFERFFRADPSRARDTGGAGLGLALARALVDAQGGRMWIEDTPDGGLTVKVALPRA